MIVWGIAALGVIGVFAFAHQRAKKMSGVAVTSAGPKDLDSIILYGGATLVSAIILLVAAIVA